MRWGEKNGRASVYYLVGWLIRSALGLLLSRHRLWYVCRGRVIACGAELVAIWLMFFREVDRHVRGDRGFPAETVIDELFTVIQQLVSKVL